jgi:ABC-type multidrug transport system ATPase subunit
MNILLDNIGKRYNYEWIFRKVNYEFTDAHNYVLLGSNGSGKSTLLQVIAGSLMQSEGEITYLQEQKTIHVDAIYKQLSYAAPYLELLEEFTLIESIEFHAQFKPFYKGLATKDIVQITQLEKSKDKQLLDEPTSNLDKKAIDWYQQLVNDYSKNRLIIVASNQQEYEYPFCDKQISIEDYK